MLIIYDTKIIFYLYMFFSSLLSSFPVAFLGRFSTNSTPPASCLFLDTYWFIYFWTSSSLRFASLLTINALGTSPALSSGTPMTPTSAMPGWDINCSSSSVGDTCKEKRWQKLNKIKKKTIFKNWWSYQWNKTIIYHFKII